MASEWVSVEERLPQTGECCLVVWSGHVQRVSYRRVGVGFACADGYEWETSDCIGSDPIPDGQVTHWMPLPAPPEPRS